mgnify:CR=1 FL=1
MSSPRVSDSERVISRDNPKMSEIGSRGKITIIRELHVYGQALKLDVKNINAQQHRGLGKWLMNEAEKIVNENKIKKVSVISGIGVREYYKKLGYGLEGAYMMKKF